MTELITTIYLNEGTGHFEGFRQSTPAQLHAASSFTLTLAQAPTQHHSTDALRSIFTELNIDDPTTLWAQQYRTAGHRSLSVGDVVVIGETAWALQSDGWSLITADDLSDAIYH